MTVIIVQGASGGALLAFLGVTWLLTSLLLTSTVLGRHEANRQRPYACYHPPGVLCWHRRLIGTSTYRTQIPAPQTGVVWLPETPRLAGRVVTTKTGHADHCQVR
jgi:hypothetical protein